ncbi:TPA: hypothetical protein ACVB8O_002167 [Acinetobacter baumannii]
MAIKQKPKNRKKTYKPKIAGLNKPGEYAELKGLNGLVKAVSSLPPPKKYYLDMTWDLEDAERTIDFYCVLEGIPTDKKGLMPLHVLQGAYKGDLIIALRKNLIPENQHFKIEITCKARRIDDPSVVVDVRPFKVDFSEQAIDYATFMEGPARGRYFLKRKGGVKTLWKGITKEWKLDLDEQYSDEYEIIGSKAVLSCETYFRSKILENQFLKLKAEYIKKWLS